MKNFIAAVIVISAWLPGVWFLYHLRETYGSGSGVPMVAIPIAVVLFVLPWHFIFASNGKYMAALMRMLTRSDDQGDD